MMDLSSLHVPDQCNPLYGKPHQVINPATQGDRIHYEKKGFSDWMNIYLQNGSHPTKICDLQEDLADGITLLYFVHQISFEVPPCVHRQPTIYVHRLENTEACLGFLDGLGVDLRGIFAEDITRGNIKTILALCRAMYIRFEGGMTEDHRSLSPVLSWKRASPSSALSAVSSDFSHPQLSWQQDDETETVAAHKYISTSQEDVAVTSSETTAHDGIFTVWYKEDMAVIGWIQRLLGLDLKDYSEFADGILLCAIVNQLWDGSITQEEVLFSTPLERLEIATEAAEQFLGVPRPEFDLKDVIAGQGREALPQYLLELKAASEEMFQDYMAIVEDRLRTKNEEETVERMRRRLIREHSREARATPTVTPTSKTNPENSKMGRSLPRENEPAYSSHRTKTAGQGVSQGASVEGRVDPLGRPSRSSGLAKEDQLPGSKWKPPIKAVSFPESNDCIPPELFKHETLEAEEALVTSLASLMQAETEEPSSPKAGAKDAGSDGQISTDPLVSRSSYPTLASPGRSQMSASVIKQPQQPNVSSFFSPFSMPFVSIREGGRDSSQSKYKIPVRNSSPSVPEADSLNRGKLTSWSHKNVKDSQTKEIPSKEPVSPARPGISHRATMLARLAARSPGGIADSSSSDSDD